MSSAMALSATVAHSEFLSDDNDGFAQDYILNETLLRPILDCLLPSFMPVSDTHDLMKTSRVIAASPEYLVTVESKGNAFAISLQVASNDLAAMIALRAVSGAVFGKLKTYFNNLMF